MGGKTLEFIDNQNIVQKHTKKKKFWSNGVSDAFSCSPSGSFFYNVPYLAESTKFGDALQADFRQTMLSLVLRV